MVIVNTQKHKNYAWLLCICKNMRVQILQYMRINSNGKDVLVFT